MKNFFIFSIVFFSLQAQAFAGRIGSYPQIGSADGTEKYVIVSSGATKYITTDQIIEYITPSDIEFTQTGAGASASDINVKLKQRITVDDFPDLATAVTAQGSTPTLLIGSKSDMVIADGVTVSIPATMVYVPMGGKIVGTAGGSEEKFVINGGLLANPYEQIYDITNLTINYGNKISKIYPYHFGCVADNSTNNAACFDAIATVINQKGGKCLVDFGWFGTYLFAPASVSAYDGANAWRGATELVDVEYVTFVGKATIKQDVPDGWDTGDAAALTRDEPPFQFRTDAASGAGACHHITIQGLTYEGELPAGSYPENYTADGAAMGWFFRGCYEVTLIDTHAKNCRTDGFYFGPTYGNTYFGRNNALVNCTADGNQRQGLSVTGVDNFRVIGGRFENTGGSSFGHGIDIESASLTKVVDGGAIIGAYFTNNERGALNFIMAQNIEVANNQIIENHASQNGAIYIDGGVSGYRTEKIDIHHNNIKTTIATLYVDGDYIKDVSFTHNNVLTTSTPNSKATVRINAQGSSPDIDNFYIEHNKFRGTGGVMARGTAIGSPLTITNITQANPAVVTSAGHGLSDGQRVWVSGVVGMVEINDNAFTVLTIDADTFYLLGEKSTNYTAYTSGGTAQAFYDLNIFIRFNDWEVSQQNASASTDIFQFYGSEYTNFVFENNKVRVSNDIDPASPSYPHTVLRGSIKNNDLKSDPYAEFYFRDSGPTGNRSTVIGYNDFSQYFYYYGPHSSLHLEAPGAVVSYNGGNRILHGGTSRVSNGVDAIAGDITYSFAAVTGNPVIYQCTVSGSPGTWVGRVDAD